MKKSRNEFHIAIISPQLIWILTWGDKNVRAMAFWPLIIYKSKDISRNKIVQNHELIHHRQQIEMLIIPFYIFYFITYWAARFKHKTHLKAYHSVCFEKEAYAMENDLKYLNKRKAHSWMKWL